MRLRGVFWALLVLEVRPNPSWDQRTTAAAAADPGEVPHGVEGDLRVVSAGLDAQIAAREAGIEVVAGKFGYLLKRPGPAGGEPETVLPVPLEERWPEPEGNRKTPGRQILGLTGVFGRYEGVVVFASYR